MEFQVFLQILKSWDGALVAHYVFIANSGIMSVRLTTEAIGRLTYAIHIFPSKF